MTSSDTDVIEVNSFRAFVYRPLGEDNSADKKVTLTVKIESKTNPNLFVTKNIDVTVKHLSRENINAQLDLMDRAKDNYASGLLGSNADAYSIIDNLSPYQEIVWNSDKSDVNFIRSHSDIQGNGIIIDTLPNWEEQEDWRLFRTSDKDLISNETLILNKTPDENKFVKINSVLTDETLGKYYSKFCNDKNYDVEALAKFKQLYKQPVSAYVMVIGADEYTEEFVLMPEDFKAQIFNAKLSSFKNEMDKPISVTFTLLGLDGATMIAKTTENSFTKGATVFDVFKKAVADNNMKYTSKGSYISSINGLAEKDYGGNSGWMYSVDGIFVNSYMNAQELSGGEDIVVMYVRNYQDANKLPDNNQTDDNSTPANDDNQNGNSTPGNNTSQNINSNQNSNNVNNPNDASGNKTNAAENNSVSPSQSTNNQTASTNKKNDNAVNSNPENDGNISKEPAVAENNNNHSNWKWIFISVVTALFLILIIILVVLKQRKSK